MGMTGRKVWAWGMLAVLVAAGATPGQGNADKEVSYTIDPGKVLNRIDEKVYGHFFEHIYHSANGGLWGELVWNRSFEENTAGRWSIEDGQLIQSGSGTDLRLVFGDRAWTDYEYTLEAQKTGGAEGFLILFRAASDQDYYWYNIGGWGNVRHQLEKGAADGRRTVGRAVEGKIETGKWYPIRVRCQGNRFQVWLDGRRVLDYTDERSPHLAGQVGISTWSTQARFRNFKVTTLDGKTLYEGLERLRRRQGRHRVRRSLQQQLLRADRCLGRPDRAIAGQVQHSK